MAKLKSIIFWGACWGIVEMTLGWVMHLAHFKGEALLLYPFGLICMMMAMKQTGQVSAVIKVAGVAALVKLVNLFMLPTVPVYHVTNPAVAIFLEGLATWGFCFFVQKKPSFEGAFLVNKIFVAILMVFASLLLFRGWQQLMDAFVAYNPFVHKPFDGSLIVRWGWLSAVQGIMLAGVVYFAKYVPSNFVFTKWTNRLAIPFLFISLLMNILH